MSILPLLFVQTATSRNNYPINRDLSLRFMRMDSSHCNVAKELTQVQTIYGHGLYNGYIAKSRTSSFPSV